MDCIMCRKVKELKQSVYTLSVNNNPDWSKTVINVVFAILEDNRKIQKNYRSNANYKITHPHTLPHSSNHQLFQLYTLSIIHSSNNTLFQSYTLLIIHSSNYTLFQSYPLPIKHSSNLYIILHIGYLHIMHYILTFTNNLNKISR